MDTIEITLAEDGAVGHRENPQHGHVGQLIDYIPTLITLAPADADPDLVDEIVIVHDGATTRWLIGNPDQTDAAMAAVESMIGRPDTLKG